MDAYEPFTRSIDNREHLRITRDIREDTPERYDRFRRGVRTKVN